MIDKPEIVQTEARPTAIIHLVVAREEIQKVMGPAISEVMAAIKAQGIAPAGPWFTHHLKRPGDVFDFDVGVPVTRPVTADGLVQPAQLRATRVARTVYRGGYEGLGAAWGEFTEWIQAQGLHRAGDLWEFYVKGPESGDDPAAWCTQLNQPLED